MHSWCTSLKNTATSLVATGKLHLEDNRDRKPVKFVFSVWVYCPSQTGIRFDNEWTVVGFHLNSNTGSNGIRIDDKLIGIDNYDISDEQLIQHMMKVYPGDEIKITILRNSKRIEASVAALPN